MFVNFDNFILVHDKNTIKVLVKEALSFYKKGIIKT